MVEPDNKWGGGDFSDNGPKTVYVFTVFLQKYYL